MVDQSRRPQTHLFCWTLEPEPHPEADPLVPSAENLKTSNVPSSKKPKTPQNPHLAGFHPPPAGSVDPLRFWRLNPPHTHKKNPVSPSVVEAQALGRYRGVGSNVAAFRTPGTRTALLSGDEVM